VWWLAAGPRVAAAQNAEAERLFVEGEGLIAAGKIAAGCSSFEASNRLEPRAGTFIHIGLCKEKLGKLASALAAYRGALARVKDPRKKAIATERAAALEPRVSSLTVSVPAESRIAGLVIARDGAPIEAAQLERALPVDGGSYRISASAPGFEPWSTSVGVAAERDRASVMVPRLVPEAPREAPPVPGALPAPGQPALPLTTTAPAADPAGRGSPAAVRREPSMFTTRRKLAVAMAAAGAGLVGGAVVLGRSAQGDEREAFERCPSPEQPCPEAERANRLLDDGNQKALVANIGYAAGGAAIVGAAVLWLTGRPVRAESRIAVIPRSDGPGVSLRVRF
jgi:hypothetical protein